MVRKANVISKMDLSKGCYQVETAEEDIEKMAFTCHKGWFEFLRMPFGVKNAPAIFQTPMKKEVKRLGHCVRA